MSPILGQTTAEIFLRDYWQQKPLLIRHALTGFTSPISPDELAGLSLEEDIESRIVTCSNGKYQVQYGPLNEDIFKDLPEQDWTLMVQAVDREIPEVEALIDHFSFLPRWRVDDIMVSYATTGGGVGPHFDFYDVFLLQVEGRREWKVGQICNGETELVENDQLKLVKQFDESECWVLDPGDMLYLPPKLAHWGTAIDECLTYSIGFRAPTIAEILGDLAIDLTGTSEDRYYRDPPLTPEMAQGEIDDAFVRQVQALLQDVVDDKELIREWLRQY